jgi:hypothetical protein
MSLQAQNAAKATAAGFSDWDDYESESGFDDDEFPAGFVGDETSQGASADESDEFAKGVNGCKRYKSCKSSGCCECSDEFDEVHCALGDLSLQLCDIQHSQEIQDSCLANIKDELGD